MVLKAVKREVAMARRCLGVKTIDVSMEDEEEDKDVDDFLDFIEALEIGMFPAFTPFGSGSDSVFRFSGGAQTHDIRAA